MMSASLDQEIYSGKNDVSRYLQPMMGKRFSLVMERPGHVGLFDVNFPGREIMSNSEMEKRSNAQIIQEARGDVLIAGLGIGMILLPIMNKPEVTSIEVVELHQEVIDLVAPQLPLNSKVRIIHSNIMHFVPEHSYDVMYFDTVYEGLCLPDELKERSNGESYLGDSQLVHKFSSFLKLGGHSSFFLEK